MEYLTSLCICRADRVLSPANAFSIATKITVLNTWIPVINIQQLGQPVG